ncbi:MAG: ArsR/SmtB family transcription factor [Thermoleophilia bacterium]
MTGEVDLAAIGALLADRTRATILLTLLNGGLTPASVLADRADVSRPLASAHLRRLTEGGLIAVEPRGRQRLYRLSSQAVADALEILILLAPPAVVRSLRSADEAAMLRRGRLCYDHLAGRVGVALAQRLVSVGLLVRTTDDFRLTAEGERAFAELGIDLDRLRSQPRPLARACLDWSERDHHVAGSLGAALAAELLRRGWLQGREASRVIVVTDEGRAGLLRMFGLEPDALEPASTSKETAA